MPCAPGWAARHRYLGDSSTWGGDVAPWASRGWLGGPQDRRGVGDPVQPTRAGGGKPVSKDDTLKASPCPMQVCPAGGGGGGGCVLALTLPLSVGAGRSLLVPGPRPSWAQLKGARRRLLGAAFEVSCPPLSPQGRVGTGSCQALSTGGFGCIFPFSSLGAAQAGISASQGFKSLMCPRLVQGCSLVPQNPPQPLHPRGWGPGEAAPAHHSRRGVKSLGSSGGAWSSWWGQ